MKILRIPFYPWLASAYPILHLYSVNYGLVIDREVPITLFWVLAATTICCIAIYAATRNRHLTALITTAISICYSLSGHIYGLIAARESLLVWTMLVLIVMAIVVSELLKIRNENRLEQFAFPLNLIALAMILMQAITLFQQYSETAANQLPDTNDEGAIAPEETAPRIADSGTMPDIYFIVPDAYPSDAWLQSAMNFDNAEFTGALKARGFEIAPHAQSNYGSTLPALASILNMRHFNSNPTEIRDPDYLRLAISNSEVARYLQRHGYTYVTCCPAICSQAQLRTLTVILQSTVRLKYLSSAMASQYRLRIRRRAP